MTSAFRGGVAGQAFRLTFEDRALRDALTPAILHLAEEGEDAHLEIDVRRGAGLLSDCPEVGGAVRPRVVFRGDDGSLGVAYPAAGVSGRIDRERRRAVWWVYDPSS